MQNIILLEKIENKRLYDKLAKKIMQMEKKYDKSIVKIFEIINKLVKSKK
ncbi:MAG: hypothetical protein Q7T79_01925 [bacterium]|nr:hypothetical protein [bacterium]